MTRIYPPAVLAVALVASVASCRSDDSRQMAENVRAVEPGAVYAAGPAPFRELRGLDSLHLTSVLDLDREHAVELNGGVARDWKVARGQGLLFVHLPLHPTRPPSLAELDAAVAIIADPRVQPVLVRADRRMARVAVVVAAYRIAQRGWSVDRALTELPTTDLLPTEHHAWRSRLMEFADVSRARSPLPPGPDSATTSAATAVTHRHRSRLIAGATR